MARAYSIVCPEYNSASFVSGSRYVLVRVKSDDVGEEVVMMFEASAQGIRCTTVSRSTLVRYVLHPRNHLKS